MSVKNGKCIKTGAYVKVLEYGMAQSADVFLVGQTIIIRFLGDLMKGERVECETSHQVVIGMTGFYDDGIRAGQNPFIIVPAEQFSGPVFLDSTTPVQWPLPKAEPAPTRLVIDVSGGAVHSVDADGPVDVLFISNEGDDIAEFEDPCLVPPSEDMGDPHAWWRWGSNGGRAVVDQGVCDHYFLQLEGV